MFALAQADSSVHHLNPHDYSPLLCWVHCSMRRACCWARSAPCNIDWPRCFENWDTRAHVDGKPLRLPRWLHQHFGLTFGAAREKVRTARALGKLPLIDAAFRDGALSYSKVRALTRAATPENEAELLARAKHTDAEGVERLVRCVKQQACIDDVQETDSIPIIEYPLGTTVGH